MGSGKCTERELLSLLLYMIKVLEALVLQLCSYILKTLEATVQRWSSESFGWLVPSGRSDYARCMRRH